ncbi:MAG: carbohydrate kinase family protein [Burkholderiales bacterium]|jgi:adenosine kinase|nr:carbohydrate kinase family protein [Burkholderiales bacterium]MCA3160191.1 carbohydrate kinase family protein [Burkholderiales bacterium]MCA3162198.1 carbohydrate kinase family protein [Burkholderiales bacterium]MCA3164049.1 carbohydrate kinase family protein [Burkholderiales bacterium]MCA3165554.1 carbohydrate kinase family protein [Burkholderiales bacterium]
MTTLICGSVAYDTIMVFPGQFKDHILPEKVHILNVAFLVPEMRREFGGTAGNIAYNLNMLGGRPLIMATVGQDSDIYLERLTELGLDTRCIRRIPSSYTAQAFITTDQSDNQITAFHPGAMSFSHDNKVSDAGDIRLGILSPDGRDGMIQHARQFEEAGIPFIFDPGQAMPMFSGAELLEFVERASYVATNDYEAQLLMDKTGHTLEQLAQRVKALIVTRGAEGSDLFIAGDKISIPAVKPERIIDPTGCGDAYRAGLLFGIERRLDWPTTGRLASLLGSIKIAHRGGQNHHFNGAEIRLAFDRAFGYLPW